MHRSPAPICPLYSQNGMLAFPFLSRQGLTVRSSLRKFATRISVRANQGVASDACRYPSNVKFIIDDAAEDDWMLGLNSLSYIHTRTMLGSFTDFREVVRKAFRYVAPGGYFESQELYPSIYCDDGTMPSDWPMLRWAKLQDEGAMNIGRPLRIANKLKKWYEQAGFVDVREEIFKVPISPWPKDPQFKLIGKFHNLNLLEGLQALSLAFFHRGLGWTKDEIEVYLVGVRKALQDKSVHAYQKMYVVPLQGFPIS